MKNEVGMKFECIFEEPLDFIDIDYAKLNRTIRYEQRPNGEWIGDTDLDGTCKCSTCRMTFDIDRLKMVMCDGKYEMPPCCPSCGSDNRKRGMKRNERLY